jgi:high-affinity iron transporter
MLNSTFNFGRVPLLALVAAVVGAMVLAIWRPGPIAASTGAGVSDPQRLVAILQYLESDYPAAIASHDGGELAEQRSLSAEALSTVRGLSSVSRFASRIASIDARVGRGEDPAGVSAACAVVVDEIIAATGITRAPSTPPDLEEGSHLFTQNCASCHGASGHGDGFAAASLQPKPADFHSNQVMGDLTPFKAFNVIRFGIKGTAMGPVADRDERKSWALAFYLFTLRQPPCDHRLARVSLDALANSSDADLARSHGADAVACLRRNVPQLDAASLIVAARARVEDATRLAAAGDALGADNAILDAYLTDIEPAEPWLRAHDPEILPSLEASFTATRAAIQQHDPSAREQAARLTTLLDRAEGARGTKATALSVFWFALLVIVREGFEAAVIIAALLAVVKKRKQLARARFVHAGWMSAIATGAVVFAVGRKFLAGAMNERLEGCLAFVAAAMLLHAALWLNARTTTRRTMGELRNRTQGALDRGAFALFGIAFLAMFRESFETTVFLEALSIDAPAAVIWGAIAGVILLLGLVIAVSRLGLRLPMQTLFKVSTVVLVATAVVLLGQGIHAFEEVGILPIVPMPFVRIEILGVYPDRLGLLVQVVVALALLIWEVARPRAKGVARFERAPDPGE